MWRPAPQDAPYFQVRTVSGQPAVNGSAEAQVGHLSKVSGDSDPFVAWKWDGTRLHAWNDRYGCQPLFYWEAANGDLAISTSLQKLLQLGAPTDLDTEGLAAFFRLSFFLGEDTPFRAIRLLPPNAHLSWHAGKVTVAGGYRILREQPIGRDAALDAYIDLFRKAVERRPPAGPTGVPLSGGRDSRHIFLELCERGWRPDAAINIRWDPYVVTEDRQIAKLLADAAGIRTVTWDTPEDLIGRERRKNLDTNLCSIEHAWIPSAGDDIGEPFATIYEGVAGDWLSTSLCNSEERQSSIERGEVEKLAESLLDPEGHLPKALAPDIYRSVSRDVARARTVRELRLHLEAANPLGSFMLANRARRVTALAPTVLWNRASLVWCPYLDAELYDFLSTIPARVLLSDPATYHQFHTDAILRGYPRFAQIPFASKTSKGLRLPAYERRVARELAGVAMAIGDSTLLRKSFLYPRLVRGVLDPGYGGEIPGIAKFACYVLQLEGYRNGKVRSSS